MADHQLAVLEETMQLIRDIPYYSERGAVDTRGTYREDVPAIDDPHRVYKRYKNIAERLARALMDADKQLITVERLQEITRESRQEVISLRKGEEDVGIRDVTMRFVQELMNNRSHQTMVQRLSYEIGRLDRGEINDETLAQLLSRAKREYIATLDNIQ